MSGVFEARVPLCIVGLDPFPCNLQVDPLVVGSDFEFVVVPKTFWLRIQENLSDIFVPKFPALLCGILAFKSVEAFVFAPESEINVFLRPNCGDATFLCGIGGFAVHGLIKLDPFSLFPSFLAEICVECKIRTEMFRLKSCGCLVNIVGGLWSLAENSRGACQTCEKEKGDTIPFPGH